MEDKTKRNEEENKELKTKDKHYDELVEKIENIEMGVALLLTNQTLMLSKLYDETKDERIKSGIKTTFDMSDCLKYDAFKRTKEKMENIEEDILTDDLENILRMILLK